MNHFTSPSFGKCYSELPADVQKLADKNYQLLKIDSEHPSLHFKKIGSYFSVRVSIKYRALGIEIAEGLLWFWIGSHSQYDQLIK